MAMPTPAELEHVKVGLQKAYYHPGQKRDVHAEHVSLSAPNHAI